MSLVEVDRDFGGPPSLQTQVTRRTLKSIANGAYVLEADDVGSYFYVEHVRRDRNGEIRGSLTVKSALAGALTLDDNTLEVFDNFNFSDGRSKRIAAGDLERRAKTGGTVKWLELLDHLSLLVRQAEQTGNGSVLLADVPKPDRDAVYLVDELPFPKRQPTVWAAYGDTGKSTFALYAAGCLQLQGTRALYLDYEMDEGEHRNRLESLFERMPAVRYMSATRPLIHEVDRLSRVIHEHAIDYVIVDSIGPAASGSLKDEDTALAYNRALRSLGIGSLSIAHLPKPREGTTDDNSSIFGSVFFFNMARSVWHLRQATEAATDSSITVGFYHRKNNLGRKCQPLGYELRFDGAYPRVRRVDLAAVDGLAEKLPLQQRMKHLLKRGPRTVDDLAAELGAKPETLKRVYRRFSGESKFAMFQRVPGDGPERIALLHRGAA